MRRSLVLVLLLVLAAAPSALADGGDEQVASVRVGDYSVRIFTPPDPITVGVADVSLLVQRAGSSELVPDARVTVRAEPVGHDGEAGTYLATHDNATDKRYYAANVRLPSEGGWLLTVHIDGPLGPAETSLPIQVRRIGVVTPTLLVWAALVAASLALIAPRLLRGRKRPLPLEGS
jgi:hypothetical protein